MKVFEFNKYFPDEATYCRRFKEMRGKQGMACQHCGSHDIVWLESKQQYQCKHCRHRTTLRSGTVMHGSKLPFMYWFIAMHLLTATKKSISAAELQRQIGHKRDQPIWELMHKLRSVMGKRDDKYTLKTQQTDMHHGIRPEFLQEYLNEFCYKFNRRYFGEDLFDRLLLIASTYRTDFEHRPYRQAA